MGIEVVSAGLLLFSATSSFSQLVRTPMNNIIATDGRFLSMLTKLIDGKWKTKSSVGVPKERLQKTRFYS